MRQHVFPTRPRVESLNLGLSLRIPGISEPLLQIQGRVKNADGDFEISGVPHGSYELNVYISGRNQ